MNKGSLSQRQILSERMEILSKALTIILMGVLIMGQTGCACSDEDLGYQTAAQKAAAAQQNHTPDTSNGWNAHSPVKPVIGHEEKAVTFI